MKPKMIIRIEVKNELYAKAVKLEILKLFPDLKINIIVIKKAGEKT